MAFQIVFHPIANREFGAAYHWYEDRLEGLGERFLNAIEDRIKK